MKKLILLLFLIMMSSVTPQSIKFAVVSGLSIENMITDSKLDSIFNNLNSIDDLSQIIFTGSLTAHGRKTEYEKLRQRLSSLKNQSYILPFGSDSKDAEGWDYFLEMWGDDKFIINGGNTVLFGINPTLPYRELNFYTPENIEWLKQTIDSISLNKEIFFITPIGFEKISGWQSVFEILTKKNLKLIINCSADRFNQRSILGITVIDIPDINPNKNLYPFIFYNTADKIIVSNPDEKLSLMVDKTIAFDVQFPEKEKTSINKIEPLLLIPKNNLSYTQPIYWDGKIYSSNGNGLISVYDSTGNLHWGYDTYGNIVGSPLIKDRILAVSTLQGDITTLSAISGEQIQTIGFEEQITTGLRSIEYKGDKQLLIPKLTQSKSAIIFGTESGKVFCYDLETLQEYWNNSNSKGMINSEFIVIENKILFIGNDGFIYCIDSRNGLLIWRWKEKAETDFSDSILKTDSKNVFAVSTDGILYAIDLRLGKLSWKVEETIFLQNFEHVTKSKIIILVDHQSKVFYINSENGNLIKEVKSDIVINNGNLNIAEINGHTIVTSENKIYKVSNSSKAELLFVSTKRVPFLSIQVIDDKKVIAYDYNSSIFIFSARQF